MKHRAVPERPTPPPASRQPGTIDRLGRLRLLVYVVYVAGAIGFCTIALFTPLRQLMAQQERIKEAQETAHQLERKNAALRERIQDLSNDETLERLAREELGLVKPGEDAFVVVPEGSGPPGDAPLPDLHAPTTTTTTPNSR